MCDSNSERPAALTGMRVLDFTRVLAGPYCTALLSDLGAEVIKIEPPHGDDYRDVGPMWDSESALFNVVNRNKKSVVLNLKCPEAVELVHQMIPSVDVVVENFRPGVAASLGIDYKTLSAHNPKLVYTSISGFGQSGPDAHRPAYDLIIQAMSGLMSSTGFPDGPPTMVGEAVSDVVAGMFASWGTLAALTARERTGKGSWVDAAMLDSTLAFSVTAMSRFLFTGKDAVRVGNRHPLSAPFGVFRARDGHFALAVLNNKLFAQLACALGHEDLINDPRYLSDELRSENESSLRVAIEAWSLERDVETVEKQLETAGIPVAPIWNIRQALASPQVQHRGLVQPVEHARLPGLKLPQQPVHFSGWNNPQIRPAPALGADAEDVLADILGLNDETITELRDKGAFGGGSHSIAKK